tara:strand:+ start:10797 stop:12179 length:1383 start_codon:yes stop_codon:yes gene_type:complete
MFSQIFSTLGFFDSLINRNKASARLDDAYAFNKMAFDKTFEQQLLDSEFKKQIDELNLSLKEDERQFAEDELAEYKKQLLEERQFEIERMIKLDKEAARQYAFQLEQYIQNKELDQQQRDFAIQQLEEAKAIAKGERDEDYRRYELARAQKEIEREFMLEEFGRARNIAQQERNYMLEQRKNIMDRIQGLQSGLESTYAGLQDIPDVTPVTQADIDAEINRRTEQYTSDVDRAADRVASIAEAGLISKGMDASTQGTGVRGDVASRLADEYQKARFKAYDDAMDYISGRQGIYNTDISNIISSRGAELDQAGGVLGAGIGQMSSLPNAPSAMNYMGYMPSSAVYDRAPSLSANTYSDVIGINSLANNDYFNFGSMLSEIPGVRSGASNLGTQLGSQVYNYSPYSWNPSGYAQNTLSSAGTAYNNMNAQGGPVDRAGSAFGGAWEDWILGAGSSGSKKNKG